MGRLTHAEIAERLTAARRETVATLVDALRHEGFAGVTGPAQVGKSALLRTAVAQLQSEGAPVIAVEVLGAYSLGHLIARWRHAILRAAAGPIATSYAVSQPQSSWPASALRSVLDTREILGRDYDDALTERVTDADLQAGHLRSVLDLTRQLARRGRCVLVLDHFDAPRHTVRHPIKPTDLLWQIRALAQDEPNLAVVICVADDIVKQYAGRDSAFFGDGRWVRVEPPTAPQWREVIDGLRWSTPQAPAGIDFDQLRRLGIGHVPTEIALVADCRDHEGRNLQESFDGLADAQVQHTLRCQDHAATLHRLGVHTLAAVARGEQRYNISDRSDRIAEAHKRLQAAGLIRPSESPEGSERWRLVDPLVASVLRR